MNLTNKLLATMVLTAGITATVGFGKYITKNNKEDLRDAMGGYAVSSMLLGSMMLKESYEQDPRKNN